MRLRRLTCFQPSILMQQIPPGDDWCNAWRSVSHWESVLVGGAGQTPTFPTLIFALVMRLPPPSVFRPSINHLTPTRPFLHRTFWLTRMSHTSRNQYTLADSTLFPSGAYLAHCSSACVDTSTHNDNFVQMTQSGSASSLAHHILLCCRRICW